MAGMDFGRERAINRFVVITYQKDKSPETAGKWGVQNYAIEVWDQRKQAWKAVARQASESPGKVRVHQLPEPIPRGTDSASW